MAELRSSRSNEHTVGGMKGNYREALPLEAHSTLIRPALVVRCEQPSHSTERRLRRAGSRAEREPPTRPVANGEDCCMYATSCRSGEGEDPSRCQYVLSMHKGLQQEVCHTLGP